MQYCIVLFIALYNQGSIPQGNFGRWIRTHFRIILTEVGTRELGYLSSIFYQSLLEDYLPETLTPRASGCLVLMGQANSHDQRKPHGKSHRCTDERVWEQKVLRRYRGVPTVPAEDATSCQTEVASVTSGFCKI